MYLKTHQNQSSCLANSPNRCVQLGLIRPLCLKEKENTSESIVPIHDISYLEYAQINREVVVVITPIFFVLSSLDGGIVNRIAIFFHMRNINLT